MTTSEQNSLTLGEFLRQEREKRGFTIEQVASATRIGVKTLLQLESDQYQELPAVPFIRGFVTSYTRFIGLEPREVLTRYAKFVEERSKERPNREGGHSGYAFEKREGDQASRTILGVVMGGFMVIAAVGVVFFKPHHHHSAQVEKLRTSHADPSPSVSAPLMAVAPSSSPSTMVSAAASNSPSSEPSASASAAVAASASPEPTPSASASVVAEGPDPLNKGDGLKSSQVKHKVVIKADEDEWVRFQADSRPVNQMILRKGRVLVIKAVSQIVVQASDPAHARYSYNSSPYRPIEGDKNAVDRKGDATLIFPTDLAEKIQEPFHGASKILNRVVPVSPGQTPSPTPAT